MMLAFKQGACEARYEQKSIPIHNRQRKCTQDIKIRNESTKRGWGGDTNHEVPMVLGRTNWLIEETSSYVYLARSMNIENNLEKELDQSRRAAWSAFELLNEATEQIADNKRPYHLLNQQPSRRSNAEET
ncbi:hypothetical protein KIN20_000867 [Parelaphostrongylus tenuis]|uniref:Uncharacterized protein n=1 Tax=Parelaphostrongylus tenuis TaxID=148309 RepID=A0AAD5LST5_PARTN|nr:hypothetical protein KIN20_000867 [Parelaphostrongylus tenuis]